MLPRSLRVLLYLVVISLSMLPAYAASSNKQETQSTPTEFTASMTEGYAGAADQIILGNLPQAQPYHGKPRAEPDQAERPEIDQNRATGIPIPGYKAEPPSLKPELSFQQMIGIDTPSLTTSFAAGTEAACGWWIPSDHAIATSNLYEVQVLNACVYVFNTSGTVPNGYPKNLATFLGTNTTHVVGDPRALWDWKKDRFVVVAMDWTASTILIAVSQTSDPTGAWWLYSIATNTGGVSGYPDFPMLGQTNYEAGDSNGALYISWDRFTPGGGAFQDNVIWVVPKGKIYSGESFSVKVFYNLQYNGKTVDHVQPANVMNRGDLPRAEFLVNTLDFNYNCYTQTPCNGLVVWAIYNGVPPSDGTASITKVFVRTGHYYIYPVTAAQPGNPSGTECAINAGNVGISSVVFYSAGDLYFATTTGALNGQGSNGWLYWQVHPTLSDASPATLTGATIRNEVCWGCVGFSGDSTFSEYYPAVQPDEEGNVTVVYNASSSTLYPSTAYLTNRASHATGSFRDGGQYLATGSSWYCEIDGYGRNRWGDYTATYPFGSIIQYSPTFWFAGQFSASSNWSTQIGKTSYTSVTQP